MRVPTRALQISAVLIFAFMGEFIYAHKQNILKEILGVHWQSIPLDEKAQIIVALPQNEHEKRKEISVIASILETKNTKDAERLFSEQRNEFKKTHKNEVGIAVKEIQESIHFAQYTSPSGSSESPMTYIFKLKKEQDKWWFITARYPVNTAQFLIQDLKKFESEE